MLQRSITRPIKFDPRSPNNLGSTLLFADYLPPFIAGAVCTGCAIVGFPALLIALQTDTRVRLYYVGGAVACIITAATLAHILRVIP